MMTTLLVIYIVGCFYSALLAFGSLLLDVIIHWVAGSGYFWANLKKIGLYRGINDAFAPQPVSWRLRALWISIEVGLSWVALPFSCWAILATAVKVVRSIFRPDPPRIVEIRLPLRSNPSLSAEAVWARVFAIAILAMGDFPKEAEVLKEIELQKERVSLDPTLAVDHLIHLNVLPEATASALRARFAPSVGSG